MRKEPLVIGIVVILLTIGVGGSAVLSSESPPSVTPFQRTIIADMIDEVDESEIYATVYDLQNFTTRYYGYPGNVAASAYLYNRLSNITGLTVEYQGGELRNVIATLPGRQPSSTICMVGAHYDSTSSDPYNAPGASDNGGGVAIVLELARVMSQYSFNHTLKFALWNAEEGGLDGSGAYVKEAVADHDDIMLYFNYDSSCLDPYDRFILDIMFNDRSRWASEMMADHNQLFGIGFNLTYNVHTCGSDHKSFWSWGYPAVMTHEEEHGSAHSPDDTVDKISTLYAMKNGQLGMSVLARLAEVGPHT